MLDRSLPLRVSGIVQCMVSGRWRTWRSWRTGLVGVVNWRGVGVYLFGTSV